MLSNEDVKVLELAERYELGQAGKSWTYSQLHMSPVRFTARLLQLVAMPEVESDARWTMLCHRVNSASRQQQTRRAARTFAKAV